MILCQFTGEKTCTVRSSLTAVTDAEGKFHIPDVEPDRYAVLYNGSGEIQARWEELTIDFTPVQRQGIPSVGQGILKGLGVKSLSGCALKIHIASATDISESGYLYSEDLDLAFILVEGEPVSVNVQGETTINLSVWSTREGDCGKENFDPVQ